MLLRSPPSGVIRQLAGREARPCARPALVALTAVALACLPAAAQATSADRAATDAYLHASYSLQLAVADSAPEDQAAADAALSKLGGECPGVLAGTPEDGGLTATAPPGPRMRGESERRSRQLSSIESELESVVQAASYSPLRQALSTFMSATAPLRWSNPQIAKLVARDGALLAALFEPSVPDLCADARAWVASGYLTLSGGTREFVYQEETAFAGITQRGSLEGLLTPFEDASDRALLRRAESLKLREQNALAGFEKVDGELRAKLGFSPPPGGSQLTLRTLVASGRTRAGTGYQVAVERRRGLLGGPCRRFASIEFTSTATGSSDLSVSSSASSSICVSGAASSTHAHVDCGPEGIIAIESRVLAGTRSVRLRLSDGSELRSGVVAITAAEGGPARLYIQAVRGPSPIPVSMSELGADGRMLRVVSLPAVGGCRRIVRPKAPPDLEQLVHSAAPDGTPITISAVNYGLPPRREFSFTASADALLSLGNETRVISLPRRGAQTLAKVEVAVGCAPHPYAILFGLLKQRGASVLARTAGGLTTLREAAIPAILKLKGALVYGFFETVPSELEIRDASGRAILNDSLLKLSGEEAEFCVGDSEPLSPAPVPAAHG
jgi:hypothetical protein